MLLTIETVIILKSTALFSNTPENLLADVAAIMKEREMSVGTTLFEKGDPGASTFIIAEGKMRVHDGGRTLAELGPRDVFGELAALDTEPRLATLTAMEETHLFEINQDTLYELMSENIEVVRGFPDES